MSRFEKFQNEVVAGGSVTESPDDELVGGWRGAVGVLGVAGLIALLAVFNVWWFVFVVGVLIAIWHVPLVIAGSQVAVILAAVFASQFLFTWLQSKTDGSVPVVMVAHASQGGLAGAYIGPMFSGSDERLELSLLSALLAVVAAAVVWSIMRRRVPEALPVSQ